MSKGDIGFNKNLLLILLLIVHSDTIYSIYIHNRGTVSGVLFSSVESRKSKDVCLFIIFRQLNNFQLYDGGQLLLVEERTQICYTMYLGRDHRPSTSKLTNILTQSHQS
jgi:hypothetical protein